MNKIRFLGWDYRITGLWHQNVSKLFSYNAIVFSNMIGKFVAPATVFPAKAPFFRKYLQLHLTEGFASNSTTSYCFIKSPCKEKGRRTEHPAASMSAGQSGRASTSFFCCCLLSEATMGSTTMERLLLFNLESQPLWYTAWLSYLWGLCCSKSERSSSKKSVSSWDAFHPWLPRRRLSQLLFFIWNNIWLVCAKCSCMMSQAGGKSW